MDEPVELVEETCFSTWVGLASCSEFVELSKLLLLLILSLPAPPCPVESPRGLLDPLREDVGTNP